jgi:hypothetical protein
LVWIYLLQFSPLHVVLHEGVIHGTQLRVIPQVRCQLSQHFFGVLPVGWESDVLLRQGDDSPTVLCSEGVAEGSEHFWIPCIPLFVLADCDTNGFQC